MEDQLREIRPQMDEQLILRSPSMKIAGRSSQAAERYCSGRVLLKVRRRLSGSLVSLCAYVFAVRCFVSVGVAKPIKNCFSQACLVPEEGLRPISLRGQL